MNINFISIQKIQSFYLKVRCSSHQQPLNLICLDPSCNIKGLTCITCLHNHEHTSQMILPFKIFIHLVSTIQLNHILLPKTSAQIDKILLQIQQTLIQSQKSFQNHQIILNLFYSFKLHIMSQIQFFGKLPSIFKNIFIQQQKFEKVSQQINNFVRKFYSQIFFDQSYFSQWIQEYQHHNYQNINIYIQKLSFLKADLKLIYEALQKDAKSSHIQDQQILKLFSIKSSESSIINFKFSPQLMGPCMVLQNNNTKAYMKTSGSQRMILMQPCLQKNFMKKKWRIKIQKLASWIGVGISHKKLLKNANFNFNYGSTGHGSYLISSNGYTWSSLKLQYNSKSGSFKFKTGDVILLQYNPKEKRIYFSKQNSDEKQSLEFNFIENDPLHPAINLTGINDCVQILK